MKIKKYNSKNRTRLQIVDPFMLFFCKKRSSKSNKDNCEAYYIRLDQQRLTCLLENLQYQVNSILGKPITYVIRLNSDA